MPSSSLDASRSGRNAGFNPTTRHGLTSKPFQTEYKLAYKDPTPFIRKGAQRATIPKRREKKQPVQKEAARAAVYERPNEVVEGILAFPDIVKDKNAKNPTAQVRRAGKSKKDLWVTNYFIKIST
jgi:hypothetical protein